MRDGRAQKGPDRPQTGLYTDREKKKKENQPRAVPRLRWVWGPMPLYMIDLPAMPDPTKGALATSMVISLHRADLPALEPTWRRKKEGIWVRPPGVR